MTMARNMWRSTAETFNSCRRSGRRRAADAKSEDADVTTLRIVDKFPLAKTAETYARMMSGKAEFRVVLTM
jgi:hypothetical protein